MPYYLYISLYIFLLDLSTLLYFKYDGWAKPYVSTILLKLRKVSNHNFLFFELFYFRPITPHFHTINMAFGFVEVIQKLLHIQGV